MSANGVGSVLICIGDAKGVVGYRLTRTMGWTEEKIYSYQTSGDHELLKVLIANNGTAAALIHASGQYHVLVADRPNHWREAVQLDGRVGLYSNPRLAMGLSGQWFFPGESPRRTDSRF